MSESSPSHTLVIGWGSELRGDDAVGLVLVRELEPRAPGGVTLIEVPQLTPELAADVAEVDRVIFVDALDPQAHPVSGEPSLHPIHPTSIDPEATRLIPTCVHSLSPERLLELTSLLYDARPEAWLLGLPVASFDIGMELSPLARKGIEAAHDLIAPFLQLPSTSTRPTSKELQPL
jgi:hydrogenase maturation protease